MRCGVITIQTRRPGILQLLTFIIAVMPIPIFSRLSAFVMLLTLAAGAAVEARAQSQEDLFLGAARAYQSQDPERFAYYASRVQPSVLDAYLAYWQLDLRINQAEPPEVAAFLERHADSLVAERLRASWLKRLAREQNWPQFLSFYPGLNNPDTELVCAHIVARAKTGNSAALIEAKPLWFDGADLPATCTTAFEALRADNSLSADDVWVRMRLANEAGNSGVVRSLLRFLPPEQAPSSSALSQALDNPQRTLSERPFDSTRRSNRELMLIALSRLARSDPSVALPYWLPIEERFSEDERAYAWGQLAFHGARRLDPQALAWYQKSKLSGLSDLQLAWRVRAALRKLDWDEVASTISAMSVPEQRQPAWRYWLARAYKAQNKPSQANALLAPLSNEHHYYGQLAAEELGAMAGNPPVEAKPEDEVIREVRKLLAIQRALALYRLDLRSEATREWIWAIRGFDDRQLLAAAEIAREANWIDRSINTADKTQRLHDFSLRFPAPYRNVLRPYARERELDEAWIYGLIRQESRFIQVARSSVGASGLMQLMPATAQWVAGRMGMRNFRASQINDINTNVQFGTYYLRYVLDGAGGDPVIATAAYNAGPGRAQRWRGDSAMEGAIYTESIPFNETRDYVQKVMSNAMYYAARFGHPPIPLKQRLGRVAGKTGFAAPAVSSAEP